SFRSLIPNYIRDSAVSIVVYDVTSRDSFDRTIEWIRKIRDERDTSSLIFLVGNKVDLEEERVITTEEGIELAKKEGIFFLETSAKSNIGVQRTQQPGLLLPITFQDSSRLQKDYLACIETNMKIWFLHDWDGVGLSYDLLESLFTTHFQSVAPDVLNPLVGHLNHGSFIIVEDGVKGLADMQAARTEWPFKVATHSIQKAQ
ncbi:hypothetical protein T265_12657, partial [Opisthorchis viverrini]